jgi:hypothetical protein
MQKPWLTTILATVVLCWMTIGVWTIAPENALAVNNPELLPLKETPIVDLANFLPDTQEEALILKLKQAGN